MMMSGDSSCRSCPQAILYSVIVLVLVSEFAACAQLHCGTVGHDVQASQSMLTNLRFYLNTQNPAPCSGNVTTWEYCYYQPDVTAREYWASFGIYKLVESNYQLASEKFQIIIPNDEIGSSSFTCRTFTTPSVTTIQQGDVVGACVHDVSRSNDARAPINLAGRSTADYSLLEVPVNERDGTCNDGFDVAVPGSVSTDDLRDSPSTILHLYAQIVTDETLTTMPTNPNDDSTVTDETLATMSTNPNDDSTVTDETLTTMPSNPNDDSTTMPMEATGALSDSNNNGAIVGGVLAAALLLLLIIITVVVFIVLILRVRRKKENTYFKQNSANGATAIDNITYEPCMKSPEKDLLDATTYEVPVPIHGSSQTFGEASMHIYSSTEPYQEVMNTASPAMYESPLDSPAVSFSALLKKNQEVDIYADLEPFRSPSIHEDDIYGLIRSCGIIDIPRAAVRSVGPLGSGQFANVEEGTWKKGVNKEVRVALKKMKPGSTEEDKIKFLQEAAIMAQFRHPNVVSLYGVVSKGDPVILITELVHRGDLRQYLNSLRPDPGELPPADLSKLLLKFSQQVGLGMQYLAGKGFVHRDLAARNILVSETKICKVSDFGMSRDLADETYYVAHGGKIPVKWTAPEALNYKKYSTASDVWSYGCLLYEIWSIGRKPFEGISNMEVITLVDSGRRLPPPPGCPRMIYQLMILCWNPATSPRPSFRDLVLTLVGNEQLVISIPQDAIETHQLAGVLGAPLEAGEKMYQDLQYTFVNQDNVKDTKVENDNDYEEFD